MKMYSALAVILLLTFFSCRNSEKQKMLDSTTIGEVLIVADESYQPLIQVQIDTFMELYKYATINVKYLPEAEAINELMNNDSVRLAVVARPLRSDEQSFLEGKRIIPRTVKVAEDAIALIVNKDNKDTTLTYEELGDIVSGKIRKWNQLIPGGINDSISIVFDRSGSSNARFLSERFLSEEKFPSNVYATNSNASVVDYVSQNRGALGVIGLNWISDWDDSATVGFLDKVFVVGVAMPDTAEGPKDFNKPYQAYIALKKYPLIREVNIISREGRSGLGTGFAAFVAGDKGQRLVRMMGLLPATMPVRIIQVN